VGCRFLGGVMGEPSLIATDMGGTSFDVSLITDHELQTRPSSIVNQYQYFVPTVDIQSIGAGGGSLIWLDETSNTLRVGPRSAGADPGPVCYGKGGDTPTVTDADLVLGYLNPDYFLGGKLQLHKRLAQAALAQVGARLGMSAHEVARGAARIVDAQMADLIRKVTVQRGYDPRDFIVLAYGGAGPTHAAGYARELGARAVVVPLGDDAAAWSALGIASADLLHVIERTEIMAAPFDVDRLNHSRRELEKHARALLESEMVAPEAIVLEISADLKYRAQLHELEVPLPPGELGVGALERLVDAFERKYETLYGKGAGFRGAGIEMVTLRCRGIGRTRKPAVSKAVIAAREVPPSARGPMRDVHWYEVAGPVPTQTYRGPDLKPGHAFDGPAIVEMPETTIVVRPGQHASVDAWGNFIIEL
jgi:N-methylhydantoinase A